MQRVLNTQPACGRDTADFVGGLFYSPVVRSNTCANQAAIAPGVNRPQPGRRLP